MTDDLLEQPRFDLTKIAPEILRKFSELDSAVSKQLEPRLFHLLKLRASQINGCAYCIDAHSDEALKAGESAQRLLELDAWHESPLFNDKERAALAWVEAITNIAATCAPKETYDELRPRFSEVEIAHLTLVAALINAWNRLAIPSRAKHPVRAAVASSELQPA